MYILPSHTAIFLFFGHHSILVLAKKKDKDDYIFTLHITPLSLTLNIDLPFLSSFLINTAICEQWPKFSLPTGPSPTPENDTV